MVKVSDQFEVEPRIAYRNSYTDRVFIGDFLSGSAPSFNSFNKVGSYRIVIASHTSNFREAWEEYDSLHESGSIIPNNYRVNLNFFHLLMNERFLSANKNLVIKFSSNDEIYADSVMPYPPEISLINGAKFSLGYIENHPDVGVTNPTSSSFNIVLSTPEARITCSNDDSQVSDDAWAFSFPFEGKYRNVKRFFNPGFAKEYDIPTSQSRGKLDGTGTHEMLDFYPIVPLTGSRFTLQFVIPRIHSTPDYNNHCRATFLESTDTIENLQPSGDPVVDSKDFYAPTAWSLNNRTVPFPGAGLTIPTWPTVEKVYRAFYGFYDEFSFSFLNFIQVPLGGHNSKFPVLASIMLRANTALWAGTFHDSYYTVGFHSYPPLNFATEDNPLALWAGYLRINGFKYGCIHANKLSTGCFFRRNRFGHFRDMLEQRPYTKFYDSKSGTPLAAVVVAKFLSGSDSLVTASNPDLNTHDSGIWDTEGKSGRPFSDRDPAGYKKTES